MSGEAKLTRFLVVDCEFKGRRYRVSFDETGHPRSAASMIWREGRAPGRGTCNSPGAGYRPKIFWRAGQFYSPRAWNVIQAARAASQNKDADHG